jgi:hypothetical protein
MKAVFFSEDGVPFPPDDSGLSQNTQQVTFGFGRMTAVIFSSTLVGIGLNIPTEAKPYLVRIWPYERGMFWPRLSTSTTHSATISRPPWIAPGVRCPGRPLLPSVRLDWSACASGRRFAKATRVQSSMAKGDQRPLLCDVAISLGTTCWRSSGPTEISPEKGAP